MNFWAENGPSPFSCRKIIVIILSFQCSHYGWSQSIEEYGEPYGLPDGKKKIQQAILKGDSAYFQHQVLQCRKARGLTLGAPQQEPLYRKPDTSEIDEREVEKIWNGVVDQWLVWEPNCPENPFQMPSALIGNSIGKGTGKGPIPEGQLRNMATLILSQQAGQGKLVPSIGTPVGLPEISTEDPCSQAGASQRFVQMSCKSYPEACPVMQGGIFKGRRFLVADQSIEQEWFDGQLIPHQAMAMEEILLAFQLLGDSTYLNSAIGIGQWCLQEKPVSSASLTARLAGALAILYAYTGQKTLKDYLKPIVFQMLTPHLLTDYDTNGLVDGQPDVLFSNLAPTAQIPGRLWDGYGASSWQTAAYARGLLQAYLAFSIQQDSAEAEKLFPYLAFVYQNLVAEINQWGTPPPGEGFRDLCLAILDGHHYLKNELPIKDGDWEKAIRILWNARVIQRGGEFAINVAQYWRHIHPEWPIKFRPEFESGRD